MIICRLDEGWVSKRAVWTVDGLITICERWCNIRSIRCIRWVGMDQRSCTIDTRINAWVQKLRFWCWHCWCNSKEEKNSNNLCGKFDKKNQFYFFFGSFFKIIFFNIKNAVLEHLLWLYQLDFVVNKKRTFSNVFSIKRLFLPIWTSCRLVENYLLVKLEVTFAIRFSWMMLVHRMCTPFISKSSHLIFQFNFFFYVNSIPASQNLSSYIIAN